MEFFRIRRDIPFMRHALVFNIISFVTFALAVFFLVTRGLHLSIEFTGGTVLEVEYAQTANLEKTRAVVDAMGFGEVQVQNFGTSHDVLVRLPVRGNTKQSEVAATVFNKLCQAEGGAVSAKAYTTPQGEQGTRASCATPAGTEPIKLSRTEFVGPAVGDELASDGAKALICVIVGIMVYLAFRFEWKFSVAVLAAVLAVLGYSVNESVVIFDRIREAFRRYRKLSTPQVIDHAITSTMSRTIITHGSTQMMVLSMLLFGGPTLHYFAVALTIGILFGIYSSVFVAAAIAMWLGVKREDLVKATGKEQDPNDPNAGAVV
jgi:preprotein translocase subunit SecF